jgi:hypothetical protein
MIPVTNVHGETVSILFFHSKKDLVSKSLKHEMMISGHGPCSGPCVGAWTVAWTLAKLIDQLRLVVFQIVYANLVALPKLLLYTNIQVFT